MSTDTQGPVGKFVWHEVMTTEPRAALAFYSELFGWRAKELDLGPVGTYRLLSNNGRDLGGIVPLEKGHGVASHWVPYVTVEDVDVAVRRARAAGGTAPVPAMDIPNVGRFAVVADPHGAVLSPYRARVPDDGATDDGPPPVGAFCWDELQTPDPDAAASFYGDVLGWRFTQEAVAGLGMYRTARRGERAAGGMIKSPYAGAPAAWLSYVHVANLEDSARRAAQLRATVLQPATVIPGVGRVAVVRDPTGAVLALWSAT